MPANQLTQTKSAGDLERNAEWYDRTINWPARLGREIPMLQSVFGPPGDRGIIDAGCGTGRQACALAGLGYRVVAVDQSPEMIDVARRHAHDASQTVEFVLCSYAAFETSVGVGFDGLYCVGNALAAAGSRDAVEGALAAFSRCLRVGGRLFIQTLNYPLMRTEDPCVRGPRVAVMYGREHISVRHFVFSEDVCRVTNISLWKEGAWQFHTHGGTLYPVTVDELRAMCASAGLKIDHEWGAYTRDSFDPERSTDLLLVATRI